jgi:hypothetical protein
MQDEHGMARMQELLASYYGTQDKETQAQSRRDIDAPGFEPATYVKVRTPRLPARLCVLWMMTVLTTGAGEQEMLATQGLNELMRQDDRLIREIKELDTNMQMLVYENYNKFISATDTIRKMKVPASSPPRVVYLSISLSLSHLTLARTEQRGEHGGRGRARRGEHGRDHGQEREHQRGAGAAPVQG